VLANWWLEYWCVWRSRRSQLRHVCACVRRSSDFTPTAAPELSTTAIGECVRVTMHSLIVTGRRHEWHDAGVDVRYEASACETRCDRACDRMTSVPAPAMSPMSMPPMSHHHTIGFYLGLYVFIV
jgi:hypothetical protein